MNNLIKLILTFFITINVSHVFAGPIIVRPIIVRVPTPAKVIPVKPVVTKPAVPTKPSTNKVVHVSPTKLPPSYKTEAPSFNSYMPWWAIAIANQRATYNEWWESDPNKKDIPKK